MMSPVTDGGRNPAYEGRFSDESPEMHLIRLAQARRIAILEVECEALRKIKESADALYSEAEECDLPDGLGMSASQEYWDDLADALFPDDSAEVIQADLDKVQDSFDHAWKAFNAEINKPECKHVFDDDRCVICGGVA